MTNNNITAKDAAMRDEIAFDEDTGQPVRRVTIQLKGRTEAEITADIDAAFGDVPQPPVTMDGLVERVAEELLAKDFGTMSDEQVEKWMCGSLGAEYRATAKVAIEAAGIPTLLATIAAKDEALRWYAEQVAGCRKVGSIGQPYQHALDRDGGERARKALESQP